MYNVKELTHDINRISSFLSQRDVPALNGNTLKDHYGSTKADLMILLGNSDPQSALLAGQAMMNQIADKLLICGGNGHSTTYLVENLQNDPALSDIKTEGKSEAEILLKVLQKDFTFDSKKVFLETQSTNCGSNASEALKVVKRQLLKHSLVILIQDATMQLRTDASFQKEWASEITTFVNYASRKPALTVKNDGIHLDMTVPPWTLQRFLSLIMGEIPRLRDDKNGYGPNGKGFIIHVEIPADVERGDQRLKQKIPTEQLSRVSQ